MTIYDFERAEALIALRTQVASRVRRQNVGLCAIVIVATSLLGWAAIIWTVAGCVRSARSTGEAKVDQAGF